MIDFSNLSSLISTIRKITIVRYLLVSIGALMVDMAVFLAHHAISGHGTIAAALGYCAGIIAHWVFSSRKVFAERVADGGFDRARQKAMFVISALVGLGITVIIVWSAEQGGLDPRIAKIVAIGASFAVTYLLRNHIVFRNWARQ